MRVVVTGGGTGGHVYPVLSVVAALEAPPYSVPREHIFYLGARGRAEESLSREAGIAFTPVSAGAVQGRSPLQLVQSSISILRGIAQAWETLGRLRPKAILATGGYVSVPIVLAGWLRGVPTLLYLPDVEPGLAVRFLSRVVSKVAVTAHPSSLPPSKCVVTGYPVRPGFDRGDPSAAYQRFGLDPTLKTLLVWGGSLGARAINQEVARHLQELLAVCQIIHVSGEQDASWLQEASQKLPDSLRSRYHLHAYLREGVPDVMAAAKLAVSRAGASVIGEFTISRLPSVLVPGNFAGGHQRFNAAYLEERGAAISVPESHMKDLMPLVVALLQDDAKLQQMADQAGGLAMPEAARTISGLLMDIARVRACNGAAQHSATAK